MERIKLEIDKERAADIVCDCDEDFEEISDEIYDERRWVVTHRKIVKRTSDGLFFEIYYEVSKSEYHDRLFENEEPEFTQVFPVEKTIVVYE